MILKDSGMRARSTSGEKEKRVMEQLEQVEDVDDEKLFLCAGRNWSLARGCPWRHASQVRTNTAMVWGPTQI